MTDPPAPFRGSEEVSSATPGSDAGVMLREFFPAALSAAQVDIFVFVFSAVVVAYSGVLTGRLVNLDVFIVTWQSLR